MVWQHFKSFGADETFPVKVLSNNRELEYIINNGTFVIAALQRFLFFKPSLQPILSLISLSIINATLLSST